MNWKIESLDNRKTTYIPEVGEAFAYLNDGVIYDSAYIRIDDSMGSKAINVNHNPQKTIFAVGSDGKISWWDIINTKFAPLNVSFTLKG